MLSITKITNIGPILISSLMTCFVLTGCEASLELDGVESEREKAVRRTDQFQGVAANNSIMVAIGADGLIISRSLSGDRWQRQDIPENPSFIDIESCEDQTFFALSTDRKIWLGQSNGSEWVSFPLPTEEDIVDLACSPNGNPWVVGSFSTILGSDNKGSDWREVTLEEDALLTNIQFIDAQTLIVSGEFGIFSISEDGGENWSEVQHIPDDFYVQGAYFNSVTEGWVSGLNGIILYTDDGGENWQNQKTPIDSPLYGFIQQQNRLFAFGDRSKIIEFVDDRWELINNNFPPVYIRDVLAIGNDKLLMAGGAGALFVLDVTASDVKVSQQ